MNLHCWYAALARVAVSNQWLILTTGQSKQAVIVADLGAGSIKLNAYKPTGDGQYHFVEAAIPFGISLPHLQLFFVYMYDPSLRFT